MRARRALPSRKLQQTRRSVVGTGIVFDGVIGWLLEDAEGGARACGLCFAAGTPIHTDHGAVPIEQIKAGDKVWAHNTQTGADELRTVTAVAPQHRDKLVELRIAGEKNTLRATPVHPFRARRNASDVARWIDAGDLVAGDLIETEDGGWAEVESVKPLDGLAVVYNFTVDKDHDYFVGETGFLVHNAGNCGCHGNTLGDQPTTLYGLPDLLNPESDLPAKWGMTSDLAGRYTAAELEEMGAGAPIPLMTGARWKIAQIERELTSRWPGRLNKEPWAGCLIGMP